MREINSTLKTSGFTGFHFREKEGNAYELVRDSQTDHGAAIGLSEGERRFVAFLYFFHTVMGSLEEDGEIEDKVVVIDDPVCSLDSEVLAFVAALVRDGKMYLLEAEFDRAFRIGISAYYDPWKRAFLSGGIWKTYVHWVETGYAQTPQEVAAIFSTYQI